MNLDEKVLEFQNTGSDIIGQEILLTAHNIANIIIRKSYSGFGYYDDLFSESHDAIISAIKNFNPKYSSFSSFCSLCIKRAINKYISRRNRDIYFSSKEFSLPAQFLDIKEKLNQLSERELEYVFGKRKSKWGYCRSLKKLKSLI